MVINHQRVEGRPNGHQIFLVTKLEVRQGPRLVASIVRSGSNKEGMSLVGIGVGVGGLVMDCGNFLCKYQLGACASCASCACRACGVVWCGARSPEVPGGPWPVLLATTPSTS